MQRPTYGISLARYLNYQVVFSVCAVVMGKWKKVKCGKQSTETELQNEKESCL